MANWINLLEVVYPIGSIYQSTKSTSPSSIIGGAWKQITEKFLFAAGENYACGQTGGEATHKLTTNEMPAHKHVINLQGDASDWLGGSDTTHVVKSSNSTVSTNNTGGGKAHNNMPPYQAVSIWERTD